MISQEEILSSVDHLPGLGSSFARISELGRDESSELEDYARVVESDPALAGNLLRLANSAEFGLARQVDSAAQAVAVLGTRRVLSVALATALRGVIPGELAGYGIDARDFWRHCIAVGVLAQELGQEAGLGMEEECFLAGLLHDIGKLVTSTYLAREAPALLKGLRREQLALVEAERAVLGVDHTEVGSAVAERWDLPPGIGFVARWHHHPGSREGEDGGDEILRAVTEAVHVADCLAHALGYGTDIGELSREIDAASMERLGASPPLLERIAGRSIPEIEERTRLLEEGK